MAQRAGVSTATVSRVLNGGKFVKQETIDKVNKAIEECGYSPSLIARSLVLQKTNLIGVIVPDITSSFFSTILSNIEDSASQNNYNILVCNISEDLDKELKYLNVFNEMRVDGIILMHDRTDENIREYLSKVNIPIVLGSGRLLDFDFPSININDYRAAYDATKYLIELGHKKIALIGGDKADISTGLYRYDGFMKAMEDNKLSVPAEYIKQGNYKIEDGYRIMEELLKCSDIPTAVFAVSDDMAVGAMNCIMDHGLKVPDDISVVGFDDSNLASLVRPALTTVHQPIKEIGAMSVEILLKQINNDQRLLVNEVVLKHKLVVRGSSRSI